METIKNTYQYFLVFLLVAVSGFPFFFSNQEYILIGTLFALVYCVYYRQTEIDVRFVLITMLLCSWELFQGFFNGEVSFRQVFGTAFRLIFAYLVIKALGVAFISKYIKLIRFLAVISLFFYSLFFIPGITDALINLSKAIKPLFTIDTSAYQYHQNLILFNFSGYELIPKRNSGPFWEPGAYSIFLILALLFDYFQKGKIEWLKNLSLIIALITTSSTSGYVTIFIILAMISISNSKTIYYKKIAYLSFVVVMGFYLYFTLDFLGTKVTDNINYAQESVGSRFGSALADLTLFYQNPIIGYGRNLEAMYGISYFDIGLMHRNNGLSKLFVTWGILALIILYQIWLSCKSIGRYFDINYGAGMLLITILLSAFSQSIFQYPFFIGIVFWSLIYRKSKTLN